MSVIKLSLFLVLWMSLATNSGNAEDAAARLNKGLSTKNPVLRDRTIMVRKQRCQTYRIPNIANGGTWTECEDVDVPEVQRFVDAARVTSTQVTIVSDLAFDDSRLDQLHND